MVRAIIWKELREQGLIALTLLVLGSGILVAAAMFADPPTTAASPADVLRYYGAGGLATILLAVTAGTVSGGALFAAEREAGTIGFLESLPASRWQIWQAKVAAGALLVVVQAGVILGLGVALDLLGSPGTVVRVARDSVTAFAWGLLGSTLARTTLGSVGIAVPAAVGVAVVVAVVVLLPLALLMPVAGTSLPPAGGWLVFRVLMIAIPLALSAWVFTRPDRDRATDDLATRAWVAGSAAPRPAEPPGSADPGRPRKGLKALAWLSARQLLGPGAVISAFALAFGLFLLLPPVHPLLFWPPLALAAGVLAGVTVFADEQAGRMAAFWGERRLPVGRAWAVKVGTHLLFTGWLLVLLAAPSAVRAAADAGLTTGRGHSFLATLFRSPLAEQLRDQVWKYLLVPAVYGFAAGHVCGMLFRKAVVGAGVATLVGGTAAALWLPSLLAGGLRHWQVWLPPALALATARLLARPWGSDRLTARGPIAGLAAGVAACFLVLAAGVGFRVLEVPDRPDAEDDVRYVAGLPSFEENEAGRNLRTAAERLARRAGAGPVAADRPTAGARVPRAPSPERLAEVIRGGWPADGRELGEWLDWLYKPTHDEGAAAGLAPPGPTSGDDRPWFEMAEAAAGPVGIYEHPQLIGPTTTSQSLDNARRLATVVLLRGLQAQAAGDPLRFVGGLRVSLALAASLRNKSVVAALHAGYMVERTTASAVQSWLTAMPAEPGLVRTAVRVWALTQAVALLQEADDRAPFDPRPHLLAERYLLREWLKGPSQWLPDRLTPSGGQRDAANPEADLVGFAWTVPWERERTRRLLGLGFEAGFPPPRARALVWDRPGAELLLARRPSPEELATDERNARVVRRATLLRAAVRLYQERAGSVPAALEDLVAAKVLPAVPLDPFDDRPFRYRVQARDDPFRGVGLPVTSGPSGPPPIRVYRGQAVFWSVGPNRRDDRGESAQGMMGAGRAIPERADDIEFVVPLPADFRLAAANLRQIGAAFQKYHDARGHLPGDVTGPDGRPLLSWRVAILPFLDQQELYKEFKLDEPWDSEHNKKLLARMPRVYAPVRSGWGEGETFYQVFTGPGALFGGGPGPTLAHVTDGAANTGLVFEAGEPVPWTKPADLPYDDGKPLPALGGLFGGEFHVVLCDGSVRRMRKDPDEKELRKLIMPADGEVIDFRKLER